jgi:hypothetical protein
VLSVLTWRSGANVAGRTFKGTVAHFWSTAKDPGNFLLILPAWLVCAVGIGLMIYGDARGPRFLIWVGLVIFLPAGVVFISKVWRLLFPPST